MTRCAASLYGLRALIGAAALVATLAPSALAAAPARASLTDIENDVMCVSCHESLAVAQSPQAYAERSYIESGALTPRRPRESAIVRCAAIDTATRSDSTGSGVAPTTRQAS